jgi:hypothetical protein|nr:MAG TPA: hypothetical protein [Bacteriophage sp.]
MKNKEKYEKQILTFACKSESFGFDEETREIEECIHIKCTKCKFDAPGKTCEEQRREWVESEYVQKLVISKKDRAFLEYLDTKINYIARDIDGGLFAYISKPHKLINFWESSECESGKNLKFFKLDFPMVKWSDEDPWLIEDLKKLEVVKKYE